MKRLTLTAAVLLAAAAEPAPKLSEDEAKEGFVSLFNGRDFSGWRFGNSAALDKLPANWKVEDGVIKLTGGGNPHLASQWDYEDFDVRLEWRGMVAGYNSGFFVRSGRAVGANQINLAQSDAGHLMGGAKGGNKVPELQKPVQEWNEWRVLAIGDRLTFWCNGKKAWEVTDFKPSRGYLGLQAEGRPMEFRNIRIKEIGYEGLHDPKKWEGGRWKVEGDTLVADGDVAAAAKGNFKNYALRLEWLADKGAAGSVALRGRQSTAAVVFGDVEGGSGAIPAVRFKPEKKLDNPLGQWNYLEVRLADDKVRVWLNGAVVAENVNVGRVDFLLPPSGPVGLKASGGLRFRNIRIKEIADRPGG